VTHIICPPITLFAIELTRIECTFSWSERK